ncbi:glycosyl hydrolase family 43 protein [Botrytis cinerea]
MRNPILSTLLLGSSLLGAATCLNTTISNSYVNMFSTDGDLIDSTSGKIDYFEGQYLWYGLNFGCGEAFCGIESWSSQDLVTWSSNGLLFDPTENATATICEQSGDCGRPHMLYDPARALYILWVNAGTPGYVIFTSSSPTSGFVAESSRALVGYQPEPATHQTGDFSVAMINGTEVLPVGDLVDLQAESPDIFYREGYYYISASNTCGFCQGTILIMYRATDISGPWTRQIISSDTCGGQTTGVLTIPSSTGGDAVYMHQADIQASAPLAGPRNAQHGHQFQVLNFNPDGSIQDLDCSASLSTSIALPSTTNSSEIISGVAKSATLGSGNDHQDYYLNCSLPQYALYQTFSTPQAGNLTSVGVNLAGDAPTDNVTLTIFRFSNTTALFSPFYRWETLSTINVTPEELSAAVLALSIPVGQEVSAGDNIGIAITSLGITPVCVAMRGTTSEYATAWAGSANGGFIPAQSVGEKLVNAPGSGGVLFAQGANQVSFRGMNGNEIPILEVSGRELKWYAVVE